MGNKRIISRPKANINPYWSMCWFCGCSYMASLLLWIEKGDQIKAPQYQLWNTLTTKNVLRMTLITHAHCPPDTCWRIQTIHKKINKAVVFVLRENFIIFQWKHIPPNAFDLSAVSPIICYLNLTKWRFYQQNQIKSKSIQLNFFNVFLYL